MLSFKFKTNLEFQKAFDKVNCFRVLDLDGHVSDSRYEILSQTKAVKILELMIKLNQAEIYFENAQRNGFISFFMTSKHEEGSTIGSCAALESQDVIYPQYREAGAFLWRGFSIQDMAHQLTANDLDLGKGRQMPVHYGSNAHNISTVSSPLCTQVPQASGAGYHYRVQGMDKIAVTYFGDGAASEGDFHSALNFAATLKSQTLFFCRNNLFAISTPIDEQYAGDGIAARGIAYGIPTVRVDGNDVLAVYNATKEARELIIKEKTPVLIEAMTYRGGNHSTSDDSTKYRTEKEMKKWNEYVTKMGDPAVRLFNYMHRKGWVTENDMKTWTLQGEKDAAASLETAIGRKKQAPGTMFSDVYEKMPEHLKKQEKEFREHVAKYPEVYHLVNYADDAKI